MENAAQNSKSKKPVRVLLAKVGLDGHDRGIKIIARTLRDAGYEVIYTGLHQLPEAVVQTAIDEDVDIVGLSSLSGAHMTVFQSVMNGLKAKGADTIKIFGGGIVPPEDVVALKKQGILEIFPPETPTSAIIEFLKKIFC